MIIGNLVVLNLFLALLLSSFGAESLQQSQDDSEPNKLQEAVDRINRFAVFIKSHVMYCIKVKIRRKGVVDGYDQSITRTDVSSKDIIVDGDLSMRNGRICDHEHEGDTDDNDSQDRKDPSDGEDSQKKESDLPTRPASIISTSSKASRTQSESKLSKSLSSEVGGSKYDVEGGGWSPCTLSLSKDDSQISKPIEIDPNEGPEINEVNVVFVRYPDDCCPSCCNKRSPCCDSWIKTPVGKRWWSFRCYMYKLVEHKYFETFIILMICASSLSLAIEDVYIGLPNRVWLAVTLVVMDKIFTVIFVFEMLIKWSAYGFKKYFTDAWCWLDFIIVAISLVSLGAEGAGMGNIGAFRALRTLRALRPLRAVSRWEGMKVVVNALIQAIPAICNVLLVCLVFWLIFSIMGVQLFGGRFHKCKCPDGEDFVVCNASIVPNREVCRGMNYTWENSRINFDNVFNAYLALFQVATFKGWMEILQDATDSREEKEQPVREARVGMYMYFVLFIVFGSFFTLNLFIGVIIDNFNMQKKKAGGSLEMFMTEDQKKYYNAMKKLGSKQPQKPIPKPRLKCQQFFFTLTTNQKFDIGIMAVIMLNMLTMAMEHYEQSYMFETALKYVNQVFIAIFTLEAIMKIIGLRWYYFKQPWNVFDFVVVVLSILGEVIEIGLAMSDAFKDYFVSPTLLRVVRVFRVGRVLRLVKSAKGIRTLLFSLAVSLPALFNIGLLLFLVMFIYAIFGMSFFMNVRHTGGLDAMFNFETFGRSMILLFQISTSAGWDGVLAGITNDVDCNAPNATMKDPGDCGSRPMGIFYLITYLVITFLVVINMYIAVILENFSQATEDVQQGLTQDDFDMYYEIWEKYDEEATQYIPFSVLPDFVDALEEPLRLPAPNYYKLVSLEIPICKDEKVHCVDILDALTKNFLGTTGDAAGDLGDVKKGPERVDYSPIGTTLLRQREIFCAKIIQRAYRKYREKRGPLEKIEKPIGNAAPTDNKNVVVDIEQEPTEKEHESLEKKRDAENVPEIVVKDDKDEPIPHCAGPDESRTVELYPDSGVVA